MKRLALTLVLMAVWPAAFSQKLYFVYFQSETGQPFYVRLNDRVHNSSASGYLILPRLVDSTYQLKVGFPQNKWPEQKFPVAIRAHDHGYVLKNAGDQGWVLYDIENGTNVPSLSESGPRTGNPDTGKVSQFTEILAVAANDPSLRIRPADRDQKPDKAQPSQATGDEKQKITADQPTTGQKTKKDADSVFLAKRDDPAVKKEVTVPKAAVENPPKEDKPKETADQLSPARPPLTALESVAAIHRQEMAKADDKPAVPVAEYKRPVITKKAETGSAQGLNVMFIDEYGAGKKDTVWIQIPVTKKDADVVTEQPHEEKRFLDISSGDPVMNKPNEKSAETPADPSRGKMADKPKVAAKDSSASQPASGAAKNNCRITATDADFLRLRKKMAAAEGDDEMISEAKKDFRTRCYSSEQVKHLSALFLNDAGKYGFFDAAYFHVTDPDQFALLVSELKDDYYINRFRAMLR